MTTNVRLSPLAIALALSLPLLGGCGQKSPESRIEDAKQALQKADNKAAIIELKTALQEAPNNGEARFILGQTLQAVSQWDSSEKELRKAMELGVPADRVLPLLAKALARMGKYKEVIDLTMPKTGLASSALTTMLAEKANAYISLNKKDEAAAMIEDGEKVLAAVGGGAMSNNLQLAKARLALVNKQPAQAMALLDTALKRDGKFVEGLYLKAQLLQNEDKSAEAQAIYQQIIAVKPDEAPAHLSIADYNVTKGDLAAAEKNLLAVEKINAKLPMLNFVRAKASLFKGDLKKANEALQQVLSVAPEHLPSLMLDASISYSMGNYEQSLKSASKVLTQVPGHLYTTRLMAANELRQGQPQAALNLLLPLTKANPDDSELLSMIGDAYLQAKQIDKAMPFLDRAAALQPKDAAIKQGQARGLLAQGKADQAIRELEQAVRISEKSGQADMSLIMLHINRQEFDKALQAIATLDKKQPNSPITNNLTGLVYLGKKDVPAARKAFEQALAIQPDFFAAAANLARLDLDDKKPDAARQRFESVLKKDEKNLQALMALARLAASLDKDQESLAWLEKAAKANQKAIAPRAGMVNHYLSKKNPQKALSIAHEAVSAAPDSEEALSLLGAAQMATGDKVSAVSSFVRAAEKAGQSIPSLHRLGAAQVAAGRPAEGQATYEKILARSPGNQDALDRLLVIDLSVNKADRAIQRARAFQVNNPKSATGFTREGDILYGQKQYAQSAKLYEQALNRTMEFGVYSKMVGALVKAGNTKLAEKKLGELMRRYPDNIMAQFIAADYALGQGRKAEAMRLYEGMYKAHPQNPTVLNNLAMAYQQARDARALSIAEQAYKLAPKQPGILDTLGWILVEQGQASRGLPYLAQALELAPKAGSIRYHLALAKTKSGDKNGARQELETLFKEKTNFPEIEEARVLLNTLRGGKGG